MRSRRHLRTATDLSALGLDEKVVYPALLIDVIRPRGSEVCSTNRRVTRSHMRSASTVDEQGRVKGAETDHLELVPSTFSGPSHIGQTALDTQVVDA